MQSRNFLTTLVVLLFLHSFAPADDDLPRVFVLDGNTLAQTRLRVRQRPADFAAAMQQLREAADEVLERGPWSVMDKRATPPSGDKHDYYSVGPYWWPDPNKPDGLPYIRQDGKVNPERYNYDSEGLSETVAAVEALARGWYFTNEPRYAERAALLLRTWFLDTATMMNPHLQYGQAIPGITDGRGIGIIDTACVIGLIDSVGLLGTSPAWTTGDQTALTSWFDSYLQWLRQSQHGQAEDNTANNHSVWYDAQVACFALFVDDLAIAREVLQKVGPRRIATQIEPDGSMPHELARTKSFSYTSMNTRGFLTLARLGEHVDVDLWHFRSADGRSLEGALDWLEPFVSERQEWKWQQIASFDPSRTTLLFRWASPHFEASRKPVYRQLGSVPIDPVTDLLWPVP